MLVKPPTKSTHTKCFSERLHRNSAIIPQTQSFHAKNLLHLEKAACFFGPTYFWGGKTIETSCQKLNKSLRCLLRRGPTRDGACAQESRVTATASCTWSRSGFSSGTLGPGATNLIVLDFLCLFGVFRRKCTFWGFFGESDSKLKNPRQLPMTRSKHQADFEVSSNFPMVWRWETRTEAQKSAWCVFTVMGRMRFEEIGSLTPKSPLIGARRPQKNRHSPLVLDQSPDFQNSGLGSLIKILDPRVKSCWSGAEQEAAASGINPLIIHHADE